MTGVQTCALPIWRQVALVTAPGPSDRPTQSATIVDRYPLDPVTAVTLPILTDAQRFGRYLRAGQIRDVTVLAGGLGTDARALLSIDVTTDARRISGVHHSVDTSDTRLFSNAIASTGDCMDVMFPYDFALSAVNNVNASSRCSSRGFLLASSTQSWRGSAAPPSADNVQTSSSVRSVDDYGRVTSVFYQNDIFRSDDDVCVDVQYAAPANLDQPVLTAIASRKVWACGKGNAVLAQEAFEYDHLFPGLVSRGRPTSHLVFRHAADTGSYLGTIREYDAEYDASGNPIKIAGVREDGARRATEISYDPFGLTPETTQISATNVAAIRATLLNDPISGALVGTKDQNGTIRGTTFDGFGRPVLDTIMLPGAPAPGVLAARTYLGFDGADPQGRRVSVKQLTDPVAPIAVDTERGRISTSYFDELGRPRFGHIELGEDYVPELMIVGQRTYDPLGRIAFEADAYPKNQPSATTYGTTRYFSPDGSLALEIRGAGPQPFTTTPSASAERFPSSFRHVFTNHLETTISQSADAFTPGLPQFGVTRAATSTAIGRILSRSTWQSGVRLEHETLGYDHLGQLSGLVRYQNPAAAANPVVWSWQLDSLGQLLFLNEPSSAPQQRLYSDWGQLTATTWYPALSEPTHGVTMSYDALGRLMSSEEQTGGVGDPATTSKYQYDVPGTSPFVSPTYVAGRLASATTASSTVVLGYDGFGRVNARTFTDDTYTMYSERHGFHGDGSEAWIELRLPDNAYQPERVDDIYDSAGRVRRMQFVSGATTQELFSATDVDTWGRLRKASYGQTQLAADYADLGRRLPQAVKVNSPQGARSIAYSAFDPVGRELARDADLPNAAGHEIQSYDPLGRLQGMRRTQGATTTAFSTFNFDALGNVTTLNDQLSTADATLSFLTSDRDQICAVSYGGTPGSCNVEHDSIGNIVYEPTRTGYNKLAYGSSGDVRRIENEAGVTATFKYGPFGDVTRLSIVQGTTLLRSDRHVGAFITARAQKGSQGSVSYIARQFSGPGLAVSRRGPTGPWIYEFKEARGTRFTTDENGAFVQDVSYTPFGQPTVSGATPGAIGFTNDQWNAGDALDGFGLVHLGSRVYDPVIGRFLSRDPLMISRTAATSNPYAFALNDPMNLSDPTGLSPCGSNFLCISASSNGDDDASTAGSAVALGIWAAGYLYSTGAEPPMNVSSKSAISVYSTAFDSRASALDQYALVNRFLEGPSLAGVGARIAGGLKVAAGAAGFVVGAGLCVGTGFGCVIGIALMAASADVAGSGVPQAITGEHYASVAETFGGPFAGQLEDAAVNALGLANLAVNGTPSIAEVPGGPGSPGGAKATDLVYRADRQAARPIGVNPATTVGEHVLGGPHLDGTPFESWTADRAIAEEFARRRGTSVRELDLNTVPAGRIAADLRTATGRAAAAAREGTTLLKNMILSNKDAEVILRR